MKQYISILCGLLLPLTIFSQHTISGQVVMPNAIAVCDVLVELMDASNLVLDQEITQNDGLFSFENQAGGQDYRIRFSKEGSAVNGVSTLDLVLVAQHILGVRPFSSPHQIVAADVNNSETVSTLDMVFIRKLILGVDQNFTIPAWGVTVDANQSLTNLSSDVDLDVTAIKKGDVNGTVAVCE